MDPFCYLCFMFVFVILSCLVVNCLEMADLLAITCVVFSCVFVTFPYGVQGQVRYMFVSPSSLL